MSPLTCLNAHLAGLLGLAAVVVTAAERRRSAPSDDSWYVYDRLDVWVLKVSIGLPLLLLGILLIFHLTGYLSGKLPRKARRQSPEPPSREPIRPQAAAPKGPSGPE